ncbi:MAG: carbohydrate kinase family protein [Geminicoccaceae bacterium]
MRYDYSCIGFYTFDCLGRPVTQIPPGADTYFIDELTLAVSGAAGSAAIVAAKYGLKVLAVGGVGEDDMGDWVLQKLDSFDVDTSMMQRCPGVSTSSSIVTTRPDGARPALHKKGATGAFLVAEGMMDQVLDAKILHMGGTGLMDRMDGAPSVGLLKRAKERGAVVTLDVFASTQNDLPLVEGLLPHTDYFLPSIEETEALSGLSDPRDLALFFIDKGVGCCILTMGENGAYYRHADGTHFSVPAFKIQVVCTCGCGDCFNAGFAAGLHLGLDPETCVRFAQATSAQNAMGLGSQAVVTSVDATFDFIKTTPTR